MARNLATASLLLALAAVSPRAWSQEDGASTPSSTKSVDQAQHDCETALELTNPTSAMRIAKAPAEASEASLWTVHSPTSMSKSRARTDERRGSSFPISRITDAVPQPLRMVGRRIRHRGDSLLTDLALVKLGTKFAHRIARSRLRNIDLMVPDGFYPNPTGAMRSSTILDFEQLVGAGTSWN